MKTASTYGKLNHNLILIFIAHSKELSASSSPLISYMQDRAGLTCPTESLYVCWIVRDRRLIATEVIDKASQFTVRQCFEVQSPLHRQKSQIRLVKNYLWEMIVNFNSLIQSAVWYFAWKAVLAHPGPPPTQSDCFMSSGQEDLFEIVHLATSVNRKRPAESQHVKSPSHVSGIDAHPKKLLDYSCSQGKITI
jgi:hypothetical protein